MNETSSALLLQQIAQIQRMVPGKLCVIGQGPDGPYHNLQCRENGRSVSRYVPAEQVEAVAGHTANYQAFPRAGRPVCPDCDCTDAGGARRRLKKKGPGAPAILLAQDEEIQRVMAQFQAQPGG